MEWVGAYSHRDMRSCTMFCWLQHSPLYTASYYTQAQKCCTHCSEVLHSLMAAYRRCHWLHQPCHMQHVHKHTVSCYVGTPAGSSVHGARCKCICCSNGRGLRHAANTGHSAAQGTLYLSVGNVQSSLRGAPLLEQAETLSLRSCAHVSVYCEYCNLFQVPLLLYLESDSLTCNSHARQI